MATRSRTLPLPPLLHSRRASAPVLGSLPSATRLFSSRLNFLMPVAQPGFFFALSKVISKVNREVHLGREPCKSNSLFLICMEDCTIHNELYRAFLDRAGRYRNHRPALSWVII